MAEKIWGVLILKLSGRDVEMGGLKLFITGSWKTQHSRAAGETVSSPRGEPKEANLLEHWF